MMMRPRRSPAGAALLAVLTAAACAPAVPTVSTSTSSSSQDSSTPSAGPVVTVPDEFVHPWFRIAEPVGATDGADRPWIVEFEAPAKLGFDPEHAWHVTAFETDTLEIVMATDEGECSAGDAGTYRWSLSQSRRVLTFAAVVDSCAERADDLAASWVKSDCPSFPDDFCLGPLDAGLHSANYFTPKTPSTDWEFHPGAMTYSVPDGWSNTYDSGNEYVLEPLERVGDTGVVLWTDVTLVSEAAPCGPRPASTDRATPAEFAAWLTDQATLEVTDPLPVSIGGLAGLSIDVRIAPGASLPCVGDGIPFAPMLVHVEGSGLQTGFDAGSRYRLYFLDLDDARTLVIYVAAAGPAAEQSLACGIDIVESIDLR